MKTGIAQVIEYVNDTHWEQFNQTTNQGLIPIGLSLNKCIIKEITNSKYLFGLPHSLDLREQTIELYKTRKRP